MSTVAPLHILHIEGLEPNPHMGPALLTFLQIGLLPVNTGIVTASAERTLKIRTFNRIREF
jgi:hypothetical protein